MNRVLEYVEWHELQRRDAADLVDEFEDEIATWQGTCVDIGCGPGVVTNESLMPKLPVDIKVVGMDISQKMIEYANRTYVNEQQLSFIEFNIETKEIPSKFYNIYDNAISFHCLQWCSDPRRVFDNIYQILRPGGKCLVMFMGYNDGYNSYVNMYNDPRYKPHMKDVMKFIPYFHTRENRRSTLKKILKELGFDVLHCSERERTFVYNNLQVLEKHIRSVNVFADRMPESIRDQFEKDILHDVASRKISFIDGNNRSIEEPKILERYSVLIAYFRKP